MPKMTNPLKKGKILICDDKGHQTDSVSFTFNPNSYRISTTPRYNEVVHLSQDVTKLEFVGGVSRRLNVTLFFDSFSDPDTYPAQEAKDTKNMTAGVENKLKPISDKITRLEKAVHVSGTIHKPPFAIFSWGNLNFKGIIDYLDVEYTMFSMEGKPIRATASLSMREERDPAVVAKESPFESPDRTKTKVVVEGMSLWSIAWEEYDDCEKWRVIAKANNIMNPTDIRPGQIIKIPALDRE